MSDRFWRRKSLEAMTQAEWESLCDGCGQCCLNKLEDADTGESALTRAACRFLNLGSCKCADYANRFDNVPDCINMTPDFTRSAPWLPPTCAYRLVAEGRDLFWWHPLRSGDSNTVHEAGISVRDLAINEDRAGDLEDYVIGLIAPRRPAPAAADSPGRHGQETKRTRRR